MRIAITGSSGFIGAELAAHFLASGSGVVMMQRSAPAILPPGAEFLPFDLRSPSFPDPQGLLAIVHCAVMPYSPRNRDALDVNLAATLALRDFCRRHGIHFIYLSSMSAHEGAVSAYGRHKYLAEQQMDGEHEAVLQLGLVIGSRGGLFRRMATTIAKWPAIPLIDGGHQPIHTVGVGEVCEAVGRAVGLGLSGHFKVGSAQAHTLRQLYALTAMAHGRKPMFIPVPYWAVDAALSIAGLLPMGLPVTKENLLGLKCLRTSDTTESLRRLGMALMPLDELVKGAAKP